VAANTRPIFPLVPNVGVGQLSLASTSLTAPANPATVLTAGANGTRIDAVNVEAVGTTTAGMVRLFLYDGSTYHLVEEIAVTAATPSATVKAFNALSTFFTPTTPRSIPSGWSLRAATHNAETFRVTGLGGDY
jgi:hypothetical protein